MAKQRTAKELAEANARRRRAQMARVYAQRDELLVALSKVWPSVLMPTKREAGVAGTDEDWLWSLRIDAPCGQLVWPLDNVSAGRFGHLDREEANDWDGHIAAERSKRLASLHPLDR